LQEFERAKIAYYSQAGWDTQTGNPTPETLAELGLGWVTADQPPSGAPTTPPPG